MARRRAGTWNDVRGRGFLVAVLVAAAASLGSWSYNSPLPAKAPGETHCYKDVCHRVYGLDETRQLIGEPVDLVTTHYDVPGADKFNTGEYTSSGELFDASNPARAAASNYPDGTELLIWHPGTKRAAHIRVNDFGPFWGRRTLDVTRRVAENLGFAQNGVATLRATVIWVPSEQTARYRRARTYPPSLGLLGVVEPHEFDLLARQLILDADWRNRDLMPSEYDPPDFRVEAIVDAEAEASLLASRLAAIVSQTADLPAIGLPAELQPVREEAPIGLRAEAIAEAADLARDIDRRLAAALALAPIPTVRLPVPVDLEPVDWQTIVMRAPRTRAPQVVTTQDNPALVANAPSVDSSVGGLSGRGASNQTTVKSPAAVASSPSQGAAGTVPDVLRERPSFPAGVASGRNWLPYWIGIALMLTTLLGATGLARNRGRGASVATVTRGAVDATGPDTSGPAALVGDDPVSRLRAAQDTAVQHARDVLAAGAGTSDASEDADAQQDLQRELARLESEREALLRAMQDRESHRRARAAEIASRGRPMERLSPRASGEAAALAAAVAAVQAPSARSNMPMNLPPVAAAAVPVVSIPGIADPLLAAAVYDQTGASRFWGNTIVAGASLDGVVKSGSPLRIDGIVDGACYAPVILVSEGAVVRGMVAAETIIVLGSVSGVMSGKTVAVTASAQTDGEIYYQTMSIDPQAQCDVRFTRLAAEADAIALGAAVYDARRTTRVAA